VTSAALLHEWISLVAWSSEEILRADPTDNVWYFRSLPYEFSFSSSEPKEDGERDE
jgi:hypothetical protein